MNEEKYISLLKNAETFIGRNYHSDENNADMAYFGNGESNNWPMQCTAKAFSALVAMGDKERALPMLRYMLSTHVSGGHACSDGKKWGHTWIAAGGSLDRITSAIFKIEKDLTEQDRVALRRVMLSEADWLLHELPVLAGIDATEGNNKPESNIWNGSILIKTALMYPDAPCAAEYMERGKVLLVNGICTPGDEDARKVGANYTDNLSLDHHGYLNTGYMVICLLHIAILHNDCKLLGKEAPQEAYRHVKELWQLVKSCISPQGRLLRIGGDTRVRYAYCQSYLSIVCRFAGDYLGDEDAYKLGNAALALLEAEQSSNADHSFFGERLGEIKRISPLYYLRCEADVLNMLALAALWPKYSAKTADIPLLANWQDEFHGARMSRDGRTLRSWVCRGADGPVALCVPLAHCDMAEWLHNLTGELRVAGRCRAVEVRRNMKEASGCLELVWRTEPPLPEGEPMADIARQKLAFALLPDGRTMLFVNRMTALKYFNLADGDGVNLKIPNDLFNQEKRVYVGAGTSRMNVDDAISLLSLDSGKRLKLTKSKQRNTPICRYPYFNSLRVDVLGLPMKPRCIERGELLADCAYAVVADSKAEELPLFSGKAASEGKDRRVIFWEDPRTGKEWRFTVDFDNLTATLEDVNND